MVFLLQIISHCIAVTHCIYPVISWWTFRFFSLFGYYEKCCYEHWLQVFMWTYVLISLGYMPTSGSVVHVTTLCSTIWGTFQLFSEQLYPFTSSTAMNRVPIFSHPCQHLLLHFYYCHPSGCEVASKFLIG